MDENLLKVGTVPFKYHNIYLGIKHSFHLAHM